MGNLKVGVNDLQTISPKLASEWDYEANKNLKDGNGRDISTPDKILASSHKKVWWHLPYDVPMDYHVEHLRGKHFDFKWEAVIATRIESDGCPYLTSHAVWTGFNDLATVYPELSKEWDYEANKGKKDKFGRDISTPDKVHARSKLIFSWILPYDVPIDYPIEHLRGRHYEFKWKSTLNGRVGGRGCPYLSNPARGVWTGFNDLATINPEIAEQWDYEANKDLRDEKGNDISTPDKIAPNSGRIVGWKLLYQVPLDYYVESIRGKQFVFKWNSEIKARNNGADCPYLTGAAVWPGFNDLLTTNPELAKEWDYEANKGLKDENGRDISTPNKVSTFSGQKVGWIYSCEDNETGKTIVYRWKARAGDRARGIGCPYILNSNGENAVRKILNSQNIEFEEQYKFKDRFYKSPSHPLRDDFAIFDTNGKVVGTIEFHGKQHYEPVDFAGKGDDWAKAEFAENKERDKIKSDYLKSHGIKQLIIPYIEFNNVEKIVKIFIDELSKDFNLQKSDVKTWTPSQSKSNEKEVKSFMQKLLKGDTDNHAITNNNALIQNKDEFSIDI